MWTRWPNTVELAHCAVAKPFSSSSPAGGSLHLSLSPISLSIAEPSLCHFSPPYHRFSPLLYRQDPPRLILSLLSPLSPYPSPEIALFAHRYRPYSLFTIAHHHTSSHSLLFFLSTLPTFSDDRRHRWSLPLSGKGPTALVDHV